MSTRGAKQSPFVGKRVSLADVLYKRYTHVDEILMNEGQAGAKGSTESEPKKRKKEKKRKSQTEEAGNGHAATDVDTTVPEASVKKQKHATDNEADEKQADDGTPPSTSQPDSLVAASPITSKKKKKKDKKKSQQGENGTSQNVEAQQAPAAAVEEGNGEEGVETQAGGQGAADAATGGKQVADGDEAAPQVEGNADEADKIRGIMGFAGLSSKAAPSFSFGFSVEEQKAAETERKLEWIKMADTAKDGVIPRRVYVGGMPYVWEEEQIREYWEYCGEIESLDIMRFPDSGRFRGIAFITFKTEEAYEAALGCDGEKCEKSTLKVMPSKVSAMRKALENANAASNNGRSKSSANTSSSGWNAPQKSPGYNVAYVGNIAFESSLEDLQQLFEEYSVSKIRMHTDKDTGKFKGYAHIHFADEESLDRAMELDGHKLHSRKIKVSYGQPKRGEQ